MICTLVNELNENYYNICKIIIERKMKKRKKIILAFSHSNINAISSLSVETDIVNF